MYSCTACKCHKPQLEIRISLLLMACLQIFGVLCSCSYCSALCINPSRKLLSSWHNITVIGQWNTSWFCIHFIGQNKKKFRTIILVITLSLFYLCTGKIFICYSESKVFVIWDSSMDMSLFLELYLFRTIFSNALLPNPQCCKMWLPFTWLWLH